MKLSLEKLSAECPNFQEVSSLSLDCKRLSRIPSIARCRSLQYLSIRFNQLTSIEELALCSRLWIIDLLQNQLSDISSLSNFQVLGWLNISCNHLTLKSLEPLKSVHIISLEFLSPLVSRAEVIEMLPHVWILNDVYVTQVERPSQPLMKKMTAYGNSQASDYIRKFSGSMNEMQKFEHLVFELEKLCELEWELKSAKPKNSKFPKFQICRWRDIKSTSKLVLASVFYLFLEGFYPVSVVKEVVAIVVTESYPENTPLVEAVELCDLKPHYLLSFIMFMIGFADSNPLWKRFNLEFIIRNFQNVQKNWSSKSTDILQITSEPLVDQIKIVEGRQQIALFVLTVLIKFEIVNQILSAKNKAGRPTGQLSSLEKLLEYAKVDEATLLFNLSEPQKPITPNHKGDIRSSILSYSRSRQNLKISENNSSRYGSFLVKTKGSSKSLVNEETDMIGKFEELNAIKRQQSRGNMSEKFSREVLPPLIPTAKFTNNYTTELSKDSTYARQESRPVKASHIFSSDNSDKLEFILASSSYLKRKTYWRSIQDPPVLYSLSDSQVSLKSNTSQKSLAVTQNFNKYISSYFFEEVLKVSIQPSLTPGRVIDFKIEFLEDKTFLTRLDIQEPAKPEILPQGEEENSAVRCQSICREGNKKWYPVPKRVRFVVDDNFVQNLKPCNFYEEHKELLPPIPERVYQKPSLMLQGKQAEPCKYSKEIVKDQDHLIRVISREKTPWVGYQLKPTTKLRHDVFCANYGELLVRVR